MQLYANGVLITLDNKDVNREETKKKKKQLHIIR